MNKSTVKFKVGKYTCRVTLPVLTPGAVLHVHAEWDPRLPKKLTNAERKQYEAGMLRSLAGMTSNPKP